jgi:hypothetical protein
VLLLGWTKSVIHFTEKITEGQSVEQQQNNGVLLLWSFGWIFNWVSSLSTIATDDILRFDF